MQSKQLSGRQKYMPQQKEEHTQILPSTVSLQAVLTAGALGNFIDRLRLGYVVDFFYFSLINFPIFNVADIFVVVSFIGIAISVLFVYKDEEFDFLSIKKKEHKA